MFRITKEFAFEAAHHLTRVPEDHKCRRPHGHSYRVEMVLQADKLDERGFVVDYTDLSIVKDWLDQNFDHRDLNVVLADLELDWVEPTAEHLACLIFRQFQPDFPELVEVRVSETAKTWASYSLTI